MLLASWEGARGAGTRKLLLRRKVRVRGGMLQGSFDDGIGILVMFTTCCC
jgi:hypothetical protein